MKLCRTTMTAALLLAGTAGAAGAHVSVTPASVPAASATATLTIHVPNERPAATTSVQLVLPEDVAFTVVQPSLVEGWMASTAPGSVTWNGGSIATDTAQDFAVTVGPLPAAPGTLLFKVVQTYATGEVVRWIEPPLPGGGEPDHPAAVLQLTAPAATVPPTTTTTVGSAPSGTALVAPGATAPDGSAVPSETTLAAAAGTTVAPVDGGNGSSVGPILGGAIVVVLVGAGVLLERRRRRPRP